MLLFFDEKRGNFNTKYSLKSLVRDPFSCNIPNSGCNGNSNMSFSNNQNASCNLPFAFLSVFYAFLYSETALKVWQTSRKRGFHFRSIKKVRFAYPSPLLRRHTHFVCVMDIHCRLSCLVFLSKFPSAVFLSVCQRI